jgi:hypothetical protein
VLQLPPGCLRNPRLAACVLAEAVVKPASEVRANHDVVVGYLDPRPGLSAGNMEVWYTPMVDGHQVQRRRPDGSLVTELAGTCGESSRVLPEGYEVLVIDLVTWKGVVREIESDKAVTSGVAG